MDWKTVIVGMVLTVSSAALSAAPKVRLNMRNFVEADGMVSEAHGFFRNKGMTVMHTDYISQQTSLDFPDQLLVTQSKRYFAPNDDNGVGNLLGKSLDVYEIKEMEDLAVRVLKKTEISVERMADKSLGKPANMEWKIQSDTYSNKSGGDRKNALWISLSKQDSRTLETKTHANYRFELDSSFAPGAEIIGYTVKPVLRGAGVEGFTVQVLEGRKVTEVMYRIENGHNVYVGKRPMKLSQFFAGDIKPREVVHSNSNSNALVRGISVTNGERQSFAK